MKKKITSSIIAILSLFFLGACAGTINPSHPSSSEEQSSSSETGSESSSTSDSSSESTSESSSESGSESSSESQSDSESTSEQFPDDLFNGYYTIDNQPLTWENGADLKNKLNTILHRDYHALPYRGGGSRDNYESNIDADHTFTDYEYLDVVYSNDSVYSKYTNTKWQREHAWAAKLMGYASTGEATATPGMGTDYHNLYAAWQSGNSSRSDKKYGDVDDATATSGASLGGDYYYTSQLFEPSDTDKGMLARAILYMGTMYKDTLTISGDTICELSTLINWSNTFAVDRREAQHNESVYSHVYSWSDSNGSYEFAQGNRNPYSDYPELVNYVYGDKQDQAGTLAYLTSSKETLKTYSNAHYGYMIKSATREFTTGQTYQNTDYEIVEVKKNFSTIAYDGATSDFDNKAIPSGDSFDVTISAGNETLTYKATISGLENCSMYSGELKKTNFDLTKTIEQTCTWNEHDYLVKLTGTLDDDKIKATDRTTGGGGMKFGSGTFPFEKLEIKTPSSVAVDAIYVKASSDNKGKTYNLTIKVGSETVFNDTITDNDGAKTPYVLGGALNEQKEGIVYIIIEKASSDALNFHSVGINVL